MKKMTSKSPLLHVCKRGPVPVKSFSVLLFLLIIATQVQGQDAPPNDTCEEATAISCGQTITGNTEFASASSQTPTCTGGSLADVYYKFTGLPGQNYTVTVNGDNYDGVLAAYTGSCDGDLNEIACADEGLSAGVEENISFSVPSIQTVYIQTYDWSAGGGNYSLTLNCSGTPTPPANDNCFNSSFINVDQTLLGSTFSATPDGPEIECGALGDGTQNDVWYRFSAPNGSVTIETSSTGIGNIDTQIQVIDECGGSILGCDEDGGDGFASLLEFECGELNPGQLYYIQVDGWGGGSINFNITISSDDCPAPSNDLPCNATAISCGDFVSGTTVGASPEEKCGFSAERLGVWYVLNIDSPSEVSLETCFEGTNFDTDISVFTGSCGDLECFSGFSDDGYHDGVSDCEFSSFAAGGGDAVFNAPAGNYYILISGFSFGLAGDFELSVSCESLIPENDDCEDAIAISCGSTVTGNTQFAASTGQSPSCALGSRNDVYYKFTALPGENYTATVNGDDYDGVLVAYTGSCDGDLTQIACADNGLSAGIEETIDFSVSSIQTVYIQTYDYSPTGGDYSLALTCSGIPTPPDNDNCSNSDLLAVGETVLGSTNSATPDGPEIECGFVGDGTQNDVWYRFIAPNGSVSIETSSTGIGSIDTQIQVLDGCGGAVLGCDEDGGGSLASLLEFGCGDLNPGQLYYIQVDSWNGNDINFNLSLSSESCPVPDNDLPCNALELNCGDFVSGTTVGATVDTRCGFEGDRLGVWYVLNIENPSEVSLETCFAGTNFDTDISVFTGSCGDLSCFTGFAGNGYLDGDLDCEFGAWVAGGTGAVFDAPAGTYYILVHAFEEGAAGAFELSVSCEPLDAVSINGSVNWNSDCGERGATIALFQAGTANFVTNYNVTVNSSGNFSMEISETGLHDIFLKVDGYLAKVSAGVSIVPGSNSVNFGAITPGDITGNNAIGIGDFSGISAAYGTDSGDPAYNELADFNCDGSINIQDYSSFSSNYGTVGDQP